MAQYYEAKEISKKLENQLHESNWVILDDGKLFKIELPVLLYFNYQRLTLYIYPVDDGYYISDDGETFIEFSNDANYYFDLFNNQDKNYHYDIKLRDNHICKKYRFDYRLMAAIDEFIRFFVYLDEYMGKNNIV